MRTTKIKWRLRLAAKVFALLLLISTILFVSPGYKTTIIPKGVKTVVIDAGHGGKDPGCSGHIHNEKDVTLAVALKLGKLIEENLKDVKVIYTRKTDVFVELEERAQIANRNEADLFISIHCNAASTFVTYTDKHGKKRKKEVQNPKPFGSETYVMGIKNEKGKLTVAKRENAAMLLEDNYAKTYNGFDPNSDEAYIIMSMWTGAFVEQSADFASKIQEEYVKKAGRVDKGVQRQSIWVLWRTAMPSILTEVGFLTNPEEEKFLGSAKGQSYLASSIFRALRRYKDEKEGRTGVSYNDEVENEEPLKNENLLLQDSVRLVKNTSNKAEGDSVDTDIKIPEDEVEDEKYNILIAEANLKEKEGKLHEAKLLYTKAHDMHPSENFPKQKMKELEQLISADAARKEDLAREKAERERKQKYETCMNEAAKKTAEKKYSEAQKFYLKAIELNPEDSLSRKKLHELDQLVVEEKKRQEEEVRLKALHDKEEKYTILLQQAEKFRVEKKYSEAKNAFLKAREINYEDTLAAKRITELEQLIAVEQQKAEEEKQRIEAMNKENRYQHFMTEGSRLADSHMYNDAKLCFLKASAIHETDSISVRKIKEMDVWIAAEKIRQEEESRSKVQHEKEVRYKSLIAEGDKKTEEKKYHEARGFYRKAGEILAGDTLYTFKLREGDRLSAADKIHDEEEARLKAERDLSARYTLLISEGDKKLRNNRFEEARTFYHKALGLKPSDGVAKQKLNETLNAERIAEKNKIERETQLKLQKEKDDKYKVLIAEADKLYTAKKYKEASNAYAKALLLKPKEAYPLHRGEEISRLLKEQKAPEPQQKQTEDKNNLSAQGLIQQYKEKSNKEPLTEIAKKEQVSQAKENTPSSDAIVFRVQFTANETEISKPELKFSNLEHIWFYKMGGMYKYTAGKFYNHDEALKYQEKVRALGYPGAFIVAFSHDTRIEMNHAIKLAHH